MILSNHNVTTLKALLLIAFVAVGTSVFAQNRSDRNAWIRVTLKDYSEVYGKIYKMVGDSLFLKLRSDSVVVIAKTSVRTTVFERPRVDFRGTNFGKESAPLTPTAFTLKTGEYSLYTSWFLYHRLTIGVTDNLHYTVESDLTSYFTDAPRNLLVGAKIHIPVSRQFNTALSGKAMLMGKFLIYNVSTPITLGSERSNITFLPTYIIRHISPSSFTRNSPSTEFNLFFNARLRLSKSWELSAEISSMPTFVPEVFFYTQDYGIFMLTHYFPKRHCIHIGIVQVGDEFGPNLGLRWYWGSGKKAPSSNNKVLGLD